MCISASYSRYLFHRGLLDIDKGMRAELDEKQPGTSLARDRKTVLGLIGGKGIRALVRSRGLRDVYKGRAELRTRRLRNRGIEDPPD